MPYTNLWNKIVAQYNKNRTCKEEIVQTSWELLFSTIFNYSDSDIIPQKPVQMGVETKRADILIKHGSEDLFVVELKRHTLHEGQGQLFSYLNQLKIDIGVLVCDKLYIYDFDYTKREENYSFVEIDFSPDNPDGEKFVELFTSDSFDKQKIKDFIKNKKLSKNNIDLIRKELNNESAVQILKNHFLKTYPAEDVEKVFSEHQIEIRPKSVLQTAAANSFVQQDSFSKSFQPAGFRADAFTNGKDNTQFTLNGNPTGGKGSTVYAAVKAYISSHPSVTLQELQSIFPDEAARPGFGKMIRKVEDISKKEWGGSRFNRHPMLLSSGEQITVSTQWKPDNFQSFIHFADQAGLDIQPVK
ncbi:MAG: type I restriction enzyme HsdR N-terminal domain-containing protein [Treponema sp.]|nr:type I restriction enzyme HsdR N-terminal domain-containing protein [Treponema sp.]